MSNKTTIDILEHLPFTAEKEDNVIKISPKPPKNLSKKQKKEFNDSKITVNFLLFDPKDLENLRKIKIEKPSSNFITRVKKRFA